jgi:hypothetical protein
VDGSKGAKTGGVGAFLGYLVYGLHCARDGHWKTSMEPSFQSPHCNVSNWMHREVARVSCIAFTSNP